MSKLRDNSKVFMGIVLFFFVVSMTVGGLVGGANIITTIQGFFGKLNTNLYVGKIGNEEISIQKYQLELRNELSRLSRQGLNDSRSQLNAMNSAWDNIIDETITKKKITELNLTVSDNEVIEFLINEPPPDFTNGLLSLGFFSKDDGTFNLEEYQISAKKRALPSSTIDFVNSWISPSIKSWISERKLRTLLNNTASVSEYEVLSNYKKSLECDVDILSINFNDIDNELIEIPQNELLEIYNKDKDNKYFNEEKVILEYVIWENIAGDDIPDSLLIEMQDSLLQDAIDFSSQAEIESFNSALKLYNIEINDTIEIAEQFNSNFEFGRSSVRFAFDNSIGATSNYLTTNNGIVVFHIIDIIESNHIPFDDVKEGIKNTLLKDKKKSFARIELEKFNNLSDWEALAEDNKLLNYSNNSSNTIGGSFNPIGRSNELMGALFNVKKGDKTAILTSSNHLFLANIESIEEFSDDNFLLKKDSIKNTLINRKRNSIYYNWLNEEKKNLEIIDLRHKMF